MASMNLMRHGAGRLLSSSGNSFTRTTASSAIRQLSTHSLSQHSSRIAASPRHSHSLLRLSSAHRPNILLASSSYALSQSRSLSLWPFSSSNKQPSQAVADVAQEADQQLKSAATNVSSPETPSLAAASSSSSSTAESTAQTLQEGLAQTPEALSQLVSTVAAGGELPHTPTFTELGLGTWGWWPPTGWLQTFLDYMTTTTGLPWWATIMGTTIALRLCLAPLLVYVQGNTIRLANIQPRLQGIMDDITHAKATGDLALLQSRAQQVQQIFKENDCHPFRSFLLPVVQMPIFISFFFALRGMADAGLPGFKDGGLAWFTDLSVADPYYVLPVASTALTLLVLETGAETGTNTSAVGPSAGTIKNVLRGIMVVATFFIIDFPAAVLLYWTTNNTFSILQLLALRTRFLRTRLNLPERIDHKKATAAASNLRHQSGAGGYRALVGEVAQPAKEKGFWEGIKQGMDSVKGVDAHNRSKAPGALRRAAQAETEGSSIASVARDRALRSMYEQGAGAVGTASSAAAAATESASVAGANLSNAAGITQGQSAKAAAMEERAARIQSARQRRASRKRI
ncbi:hypothetical protein OC845_000649 [Tilletia horrida]|nr:hypothetical protein OC845_000649 [Tilletia horrida]